MLRRMNNVLFSKPFSTHMKQSSRGAGRRPRPSSYQQQGRRRLGHRDQKKPSRFHGPPAAGGRAGPGRLCGGAPGGDHCPPSTPPPALSRFGGTEAGRPAWTADPRGSVQPGPRVHGLEAAGADVAAEKALERSLVHRGLGRPARTVKLRALSSGPKPPKASGSGRKAAAGSRPHPQPRGPQGRSPPPRSRRRGGRRDKQAAARGASRLPGRAPHSGVTRGSGTAGTAWPGESPHGTSLGFRHVPLHDSDPRTGSPSPAEVAPERRAGAPGGGPAMQVFRLTRGTPHRNSCPCHFKEDFNSKANPEASAREEAGQRRRARRESPQRGARLCSLEHRPSCAAFPRAAPRPCPAPAEPSGPAPPNSWGGPGQGSGPAACGRRRGVRALAGGQAGWRRRGGTQYPQAGPGSGRGPRGASGNRPPTPGFSERQDFKVFVF